MTKPETADYLNRARRILQQARHSGDRSSRCRGAHRLPCGLSRRAGVHLRPHGQVRKSHGGARSEFARLAKEDPRIDRAFTAFLAQAYTLKEIADYGIGHDAGVTIGEAKQAIETAERFVYCISGLLSSQRPTPRRDNGAKP